MTIKIYSQTSRIRTSSKFHFTGGQLICQLLVAGRSRRPRTSCGTGGGIDQGESEAAQLELRDSFSFLFRDSRDIVIL